MTMIKVDHLAVSYGQGDSLIRVVNDVSFEVAKGETFGLVGESGCGKSTVLGALAGRNKQWTGSIRIDDETIGQKRSISQLAKQQMVFQDPFGSIHPRHTIGRTLLEPLEIHGKDNRQERVEKVLKDVGLPSISAIASPISFPAGSGNAWRSRGRSSWNRGSCCSTSRPRLWTFPFRRKSSTS